MENWIGTSFLEVWWCCSPKFIKITLCLSKLYTACQSGAFLLRHSMEQNKRTPLWNILRCFHIIHRICVCVSRIPGVSQSVKQCSTCSIRRRTTSGYNRLETGTRLTVLNFMANRSPSEMTRRNTVGRVAHQAQWDLIASPRGRWQHAKILLVSFLIHASVVLSELSALACGHMYQNATFRLRVRSSRYQV